MYALYTRYRADRSVLLGYIPRSSKHFETALYHSALARNSDAARTFCAPRARAVSRASRKRVHRRRQNGSRLDVGDVDRAFRGYRRHALLYLLQHADGCVHYVRDRHGARDRHGYAYLPSVDMGRHSNDRISRGRRAHHGIPRILGVRLNYPNNAEQKKTAFRVCSIGNLQKTKFQSEYTL